MDTRTVIFYAALLLIAGAVAELYVRITGMGENVQKVRGGIVPRKRRLGPPFVLLVVAIIVAAMTIPP